MSKSTELPDDTFKYFYADTSMELFEGRPGFVVLRALVRTLKPLAPRGLLGLRQVAFRW